MTFRNKVIQVHFTKVTEQNSPASYPRHYMGNWVYPVDMWVMLSPDETLLVSQLRVPADTIHPNDILATMSRAGNFKEKKCHSNFLSCKENTMNTLHIIFAHCQGDVILEQYIRIDHSRKYHNIP